MEGVHGGNGEGEEVPRPRMWYEVGGQVEIPLARLLRIREQRRDYDNPEYWRRLRREQREREAMQRQEEEQEVAVNRVAEEESEVHDVTEDEAIVEVVQVEVKGDEGDDASNEVDGDVDELGGGGLEAENALGEEVLDRVGGFGEGEGEVQDGAVIFEEELNGLLLDKEATVEQGTFEGEIEETGQDKMEEVNIRSKRLVSKDDKAESRTDRDKNENVEQTSRPKKKRRHPMIVPAHVTLLPGNPSKYRCNVCQKAFKTKSNIQFHRFCGQPNFLKPFQCPICDKGFNSKRHYNYHLLQHMNLRPYTCIFCQKGFYQQCELNHHLLAHTGEKPYMCQECPKCYSTNNALKVHVVAIHQAKGSQAFVCAQCPKRFDTKLYLNRHVSKAHSLNRNPNFECVQCGKVFSVKTNLDLHVRGVHLKERPHKCELCSSSFFSQKDLQRHVSTHTDELPFKCRICDRGFKRKDNLGRHIRDVHGVAKENLADQVAIEAA